MRGKTTVCGRVGPSPFELKSSLIRILYFIVATLLTTSLANTGAVAQSSRSAPFSAQIRSSTQSELREILSSDTQRTAADEATAAFYAARGFQPVWTGSAEAERMAEQVRAALQSAEEQGLRRADYGATAARWDSIPSPGRDAAEYDLSLTKDLYRYATDVRTGRTKPKEVYKDIDLPAADFDFFKTLALALPSRSMKAFLADLPPPYKEYYRLVDALATYRAIVAEGGWPSISAGSEPPAAGSDQRLKAVKTRLAFEDAELAVNRNPSNDAIHEAIKKFQRRHGLEADGQIGPGTLAALNVPASTRVQQITANMERWRWLPRTFESRYVRVDVPNQSVEFVRDGEILLTSRVIVGRKDSPTPILRTMIKSIVANPPWNIPGDIAANQILPKLRSNPNYLAAAHMVLVNGPPDDPQGRRINWRAVPAGTFPYQVIQVAGPYSTLGALMLDSPNDFDVYLHDTPGKAFFANNVREISNGCVRVQQIFPLASLILTNDTKKGLDQLNKTIALGRTTPIALDDPVPVYMLYWTAVAGADGSVEFRPDRYQRDRRLLAALGRPTLSAATTTGKPFGT